MRLIAAIWIPVELADDARYSQPCQDLGLAVHWPGQIPMNESFVFFETMLTTLRLTFDL